MSKTVRLVLLFAVIGIVVYGIYFALNSTNDHYAVEISQEQYCADLFDSSWSAWTKSAENARADGVVWEPPSKQDVISESEFFEQFRETSCRFTVNDWAYLTADESIVWDGIPWPELKTYPYEHLHPNTVMVLEVFPKSNPLKGDHYLAQINYGEYQYLWNAINYGNVILDIAEAEEFYKTFADKRAKFEMHLPDGTVQIWRMTYGEKSVENWNHNVEAIMFASDIPGDAPNMPYAEIPEDIVPLIEPLLDQEKQFRYNTVSAKDAEKIFEMMSKNGIMYSLGDEKLFLKYFGPLLESNVIPNEERDAMLAAGYKLYPGVGWISPDEQNKIEPIYKENTNNADEKILDIDAMMELLNEMDASHESEYQKAKDIYLQVRKPMDLPFIGITTDVNDKNTILLGINSDMLTQEKDKEYYQNLIDVLFQDVNADIKIIYKNTTGINFDE